MESIGFRLTVACADATDASPRTRRPPLRIRGNFWKLHQRQPRHDQLDQHERAHVRETADEKDRVVVLAVVLKDPARELLEQHAAEGSEESADPYDRPNGAARKHV